MFQTSVSCTRNATLCIGDTEIAILCVQKIEGLFLGEKAPAGMLGGAPSMFLCLEDIKRAYFMSLRRKNQESVFQNNIMSYLGKIKAHAGMLGGAPSMFLCLEDIESALFISHLCPQGSNKAYSMYLRHTNRDSLFF